MTAAADWVFALVRDDRRASRYLAKYVTKTLGEVADSLPKRFRRFGSNEPYVEPKEAGWRFIWASVEAARRALELRGPERAASSVYWLLDDAHLPNRAPPCGVMVGAFPVGITLNS